MEDAEAQLLGPGHKKGGWITFPFILATKAGLTLAVAGFIANLIVYLINEFNVNSIDAAQMFNIINGCMALFSLFVAVIADTFLGCFNVIWISTLISLMCRVETELSSTFQFSGDGSLDFNCSNQFTETSTMPEASSFCEPASAYQSTILFLAMALPSIGFAGTSFTVGTMGANQLDDPKHQENYFNWFLFVRNAASVISGIGIVYVQDNVSWAWGYGLCVGANLLGLIIFLFGRHFYRDVQPQKTSTFKDLARVVVAAFSKKKLRLSTKDEDYYIELSDNAEEQQEGVTVVPAAVPDGSFKFLNHAALVTEADIQPDGSVKKSWKLCTVQQIEDLKTLIRLFPLWTTGFLLTTPMAVLSSLSTLQALTMDCNTFSGFKFPVGSMSVFTLLAGAISLTFIDRLLFPICRKMGRSIRPLQRVATGHVINVIAMAVAAVVESKRLELARSQKLEGSTGSVVPMSVFWLVPQLALIGTGEAFHFPGQALLYYQEFPASLKSTSTAMLAMLIGLGYYLGTALVDVVRKVTDWLPDNINLGRLDNVYWMLVVFRVLNLVYYLACAGLYRYRAKMGDEDEETNKKKILGI